MQNFAFLFEKLIPAPLEAFFLEPVQNVHLKLSPVRRLFVKVAY